MTKELAYVIPMRIITLDDMWAGSAGHGIQTWKTGELSGVTAKHIEHVLSIKPVEGVFEDDGKVTQEWSFEVGGPESFSGFVMKIWDWKGSGRQGRWSTYGPHAYFEVMFGTLYEQYDTIAQFKPRPSILNR